MGAIQNPNFNSADNIWEFTVNGSMTTGYAGTPPNESNVLTCTSWNPTNGWWARTSQNITIPSGGFAITFWRSLTSNNNNKTAWRFRVKIDTTIVFEETPTGQDGIGGDTGDITVDLSAYSGARTLIFELACISSYSSNYNPSFEASVDNIRESNNFNIYITLTGNDVNSGLFLYSSKLTLYNGINTLATSGGNLHIGFGDFSAQTSFQINKTMNWVFDTSGGIGTTTFPVTV